MRQALVLMLAVVLTEFTAAAAGGSNNSALAALARLATSAEPAESSSAISALRREGPLGLQTLIATYGEQIQRRRLGLDDPRGDQQWQRIAVALDGVAGQRDSYASGLYWYTDLETAKRASTVSGKPILSLRLLGRLDEELSCANSRFFRIALYPNQQISKLLSERFVLHWESMRPVPKVTIDFGDGRKLERTLTGNSIHYVLDSLGNPIDALPGLYGPGAFLRNLERAEQAHAACRAARTASEREASLRRYHQSRLREINSAWKEDLAKAGVTSPPPREDYAAPTGQRDSSPAEAASRRAMTKMVMVERPLLRGLSSRPDTLEPARADAAWAQIAMLYADDARLDDASLALVRSKNWSAYGGGHNLDRFTSAVAALQRAIAEDTIRNRYNFETTLHRWFVTGALTKDLRALNERVYSELFLTASTDPWLGLVSPDLYTGIENDGVRQ